MQQGRKDNNMGRSKSKRGKGSKQQPAPKNNIDKKLEEKQKQIELDKLTHMASKQKIHNCFDSIVDVVCNIGKLLFLIILGVSTIALFCFLVWSMWAYFCGDTKTAPIVMTIMQALSGLVSVFVGFWALVLTIRADKKQNSTERRLNISRSSSGVGISGKPENEDVDLSSL